MSKSKGVIYEIEKSISTVTVYSFLSHSGYQLRHILFELLVQ